MIGLNRLGQVKWCYCLQREWVSNLGKVTKASTADMVSTPETEVSKFMPLQNFLTKGYTITQKHKMAANWVWSMWSSSDSSKVNMEPSLVHVFNRAKSECQIYSCRYITSNVLGLLPWNIYFNDDLLILETSLCWWLHSNFAIYKRGNAICCKLH